jgi:hypothetical protein
LLSVEYIATPPLIYEALEYIPLDTPRQERRDCLERQGELGAIITDNQKRVYFQEVNNEGNNGKGKKKKVIELDSKNNSVVEGRAAVRPEED